ncbi:helix-turn-helix domain-containing protein [Cellvibrio fontiphilus]|uniref:Helix-turn-helix domain-containing protein n=1 Tax=Cellvibrio fontiphilus TaxID=1815559 RepID=A0ABV7FDN6_9GAMM
MFELALPVIKDLSLLMSGALVLILVGLLIMRPQSSALRLAYGGCLLLFFALGVVRMLAALLHWDIAMHAALLLVINNLLFMFAFVCFWFGPRFFTKVQAVQKNAAVSSGVATKNSALFSAVDAAPQPVMDQTHNPNPAMESEQAHADVQPQLAAKLTEFMRTHKPYLEPHITVERLAIKLNVSPKLLSATINSELQMNFFELISNYRVVEAKQRLADASLQEKPICEIMKSCGFNSKSVFNQAFKKSVGVTPSIYRLQCAQVNCHPPVERLEQRNY